MHSTKKQLNKSCSYTTNITCQKIVLWRNTWPSLGVQYIKWAQLFSHRRCLLFPPWSRKAQFCEGSALGCCNANATYLPWLKKIFEQSKGKKLKSSVGSDCRKRMSSWEKGKKSGMLYARGPKKGSFYLCTTRELLTQKAGESKAKDWNSKRKTPINKHCRHSTNWGNFSFAAKVYFLGAQNGTMTTVFHQLMVFRQKRGGKTLTYTRHSHTASDCSPKHSHSIWESMGNTNVQR